MVIKAVSNASDMMQKLEAAVAARVSGELAEASSLFDEILKSEMPSNSALMEAGLCKLALKDFFGAFKIFEILLVERNDLGATAWCGVALRRAGDRDSAMEYFRKALTADASNVTAMMEIGACYEEIEEFDDAIINYEALLDTTNGRRNGFIWNRLGICYDRLNRDDAMRQLIESEDYLSSIDSPFGAASTLLWSLKYNKIIDIGLAWQYALFYNKDFSFSDIFSLFIANADRPVTSHYYTMPEQFKNVSYFNSMVEISIAYPMKSMLTKLQAREFLDVDLAVAELSNAILSETPYSNIRLGDGEGNILALKLGIKNEFLDNQAAKILHNWFGNGSEEICFYERLGEDFEVALSDVDLLGLPNTARLEYESRNDPRGYWGVYFSAFYSMSKLSNGLTITTPNMHMHLFQSKNFRDALSGAKRLNTISCHGDLGSLIRSRVGVMMGEDIVVPGEMGAKALPSSSKLGNHFPDAYDQTLLCIQNFEPGSVVLVAAGICGKIYVGAAKRAGCIGIDIGSIADYIMGYNTRGVFTDNKVSINW